MVVFKEKVLLVFVALSFLLLIFSLGLLYFNVSELSSPIIDLFGKPQNLWLIWLTGFIVVVINIFLGNVFFYRERMISYLLLGTGLLTSILLLIVLAQIISIN